MRDGETGYVVDGRSPADIAARLVQLLTDRTLATRLGSQGRQWVAQSWQWDDLAVRLQDLLHPGRSDQPDHSGPVTSERPSLCPAHR